MRSARFRLSTRLAAIAVGLAAMTYPSAAAAGPGEPGGSSGWERLLTPDFTLPAGESCAFPLRGDVVYDHELTRVVDTFPDGSPRVQEFQGALGVRFTNLDTGESARRDVSGTLRATFGTEGGTEFRFAGNGLAVIRTSAPDSDPGVYVLSGSVLYVVEPDGSRGFPEVDGTIEDMCETLG